MAIFADMSSAKNTPFWKPTHCAFGYGTLAGSLHPISLPDKGFRSKTDRMGACKNANGCKDGCKKRGDAYEFGSKKSEALNKVENVYIRNCKQEI